VRMWLDAIAMSEDFSIRSMHAAHRDERDA
jgi:hypothetical protein